LKQARQDLPLYIYAHSLGALVTFKLLVERPTINVSGVIITSPLFGFPKDRNLPWHKIFMVKMIGKDLEDIIINSMVNPTALTKNNKFIQTIF
jgi:alpha-beta hydrolase superfamily lysophospholipase